MHYYAYMALLDSLLWSPGDHLAQASVAPGSDLVSVSVDARRALSPVALAAPVRPLHSGRFHLGDFLGIIRKEFVVS